ncbi:MAG TPA: hypothetical protein PLP42_12505 [Acidobacteriota bacterium]|nr:hypothetical protein [Acidobacteriota bacterium]
MIKPRPLLFSALILTGLIAVANAQSNSWLHVRVDSPKKGGEIIKVNVPLSLAETVLPLVKEREISGGKIRFDQKELTTQDLRRIWQAVKEQGDAEYVTVQSADLNLRVAIKGDYLLVRSNETAKSQVQVTLPTRAVDALLSAPDDTLDLLAAVRALKTSGASEIVSITDDETNVKVWIDEKNVSE